MGFVALRLLDGVCLLRDTLRHEWTVSSAWALTSSDFYDSVGYLLGCKRPGLALGWELNLALGRG